jgi:hypothetical protein
MIFILYIFIYKTKIIIQMNFIYSIINYFMDIFIYFMNIFFKQKNIHQDIEITLFNLKGLDSSSEMIDMKIINKLNYCSVSIGQEFFNEILNLDEKKNNKSLDDDDFDWKQLAKGRHDALKELNLFDDDSDNYDIVIIDDDDNDNNDNNNNNNNVHKNKSVYILD